MNDPRSTMDHAHTEQNSTVEFPECAQSLHRLWKSASSRLIGHGDGAAITGIERREFNVANFERCPAILNPSLGGGDDNVCSKSLHRNVLPRARSEIAEGSLICQKKRCRVRKIDHKRRLANLGKRLFALASILGDGTDETTPNPKNLAEPLIRASAVRATCDLIAPDLGRHEFGACVAIVHDDRRHSRRIKDKTPRLETDLHGREPGKRSLGQKLARFIDDHPLPVVFWAGDGDRHSLQGNALTGLDRKNVECRHDGVDMCHLHFPESCLPMHNAHRQIPLHLRVHKSIGCSSSKENFVNPKLISVPRTSMALLGLILLSFSTPGLATSDAQPEVKSADAPKTVLSCQNDNGDQLRLLEIASDGKTSSVRWIIELDEKLSVPYLGSVGSEDKRELLVSSLDSGIDVLHSWDGNTGIELHLPEGALQGLRTAAGESFSAFLNVYADDIRLEVNASPVQCVGLSPGT